MLSEKYRPQALDEIIGQESLTEPGGLLRTMLDTKDIRSCIFSGPPGTGKTSAARILAEQSGMPFETLNATDAKMEDIRKVVAEARKSGSPVLLYLDEIQYFNKRQQQSLLPFTETGNIVLIAATSENPYHCCYDALLSRCLLAEFRKIPAEELEQKVLSVAEAENRTLEPKAAHVIAESSGGDARRALNMLDMLLTQINGTITAEDAVAALPSFNSSGFDTNGDTHYNLIAALQKSIRGSDPNAAVFYLARLLEGGDLESPCRRLLVIAHEDIGLGNPEAGPYVLSCIEAAERLGMPEAAKPLTNAVIMLAISPKCSTAEPTYNAAAEDVRAGRGGTIPSHLCQPFRGYKYPHDYPNHWVRQQYLPDDLKDRVYYTPGDNEFERKCAEYWSRIMK